MNPLIIQVIAADQLREYHERAARARTARAIRRARPRTPGYGRHGTRRWALVRRRAVRATATGDEPVLAPS